MVGSAVYEEAVLILGGAMRGSPVGVIPAAAVRG
jgi:hypothetical protein